METPSLQPVAISLLGPFSVALDHVPMVGFRSDKARALLAYLAVEADQPHRRDKLAGLLWPDWPDVDARTYLRHALSNLRHILADRDSESPLLVSDRQTIQFARSHRAWVDIERFETGISRFQGERGDKTGFDALALLQEAVALYRGPFLDGFFLNDCAAFEEWQLVTRERLANRMTEGLAALTAHHEAIGDADTALTYTRRRLELNLTDEEAHRQQMRLLALAGQRTAALIQFENCRQRLADELGVDPDEKTLALHRRIQRGEAITVAPRQAAVEHETPVTRPVQHNLPALTTSLVGRVQENATLAALLQRGQTRLVTLTGPGGVGKTRLALETANRLRGCFADGVHFVPLAPLRHPDHLIAAIADVLDVHESGSHTLERALQVALHPRHCLLVLDNFEHILPAAPTVAELLAHAPRLTVLATSRARLRLYGEHVMPVEPLPVAAYNDSLPAADTAYSDSVELFSRRARWTDPRFQIEDDDLPAITAICSHLDGLPLAIELAAARADRFPPQLLLERLTRTALDVLADGPLDMPHHQRSLRDTIRWSYNLLDEQDQTFFRHLAAFAGNFSTQAAETICAACGHLDVTAGDRIWTLTENHLLRHVGHDDGVPRFQLLETVRQFGWQCLEDHGELSHARRIHAEYYLTLAEETETALGRTHNVMMLDRLEREIDNLRAALSWAIEENAVEIGLRLSGVLWDFWDRRGHYSEGYGWLMRALALAEGASPTRSYARAIFGVANAAKILGNIQDSIRFFEECVRVSKALGDNVLLGDALDFWGCVCFQQGDYAGQRRLHDEALALRRDLKMPWEEGMLLANMGAIATRLGRFDEAKLLEEGTALLEPFEDRYAMAIVFEWRGSLCRLKGDRQAARQFLEESRRMSHEGHLDANYASATRELAALSVDEGQSGRARTLLIESLTIEDRLGDHWEATFCLEEAVVLLTRQGRAAQAVRLASAIGALRLATGTVSPPLYQARLDRSAAAARQMLSQAEAETAWAAGQTKTLEEMVAFAKEALAPCQGD